MRVFLEIPANALRRNQTDAECGLWRCLRARRFEGSRFRRQEAMGACLVDFVCYEAMLVIDADGGHHTDSVPEDSERTARLESMGYMVLRYWDNDILKDTSAVLSDIKENRV